MGVLRTKDGVLFTVIASGGFRILSCLDNIANKMNLNLTITSACDGEHSGPSDPHHRGEAYDVRTHDITEWKQSVLADIIATLGPQFYAFLESPDTENEHIHVQVAKGTVYPKETS